MKRPKSSDPARLRNAVEARSRKKPAAQRRTESESWESALNEAQRIAHLGSWEWDIATNRARWSDERFRIYGFEPQSFEPTYDSFISSVHPDDRGRVSAAVEEARRGPNKFAMEYRVLRPNGETRHVYSQGEVYRDAAGQPVRMAGTTLDITERKQAEAALRESEERFRRMAEGIDSVFWMSNPDLSRIEYVSPAYEEIWGRTCASLYKRPSSFVEAVHPEDRERVLATLQAKRLDHWEEFEIEYRIVLPSGSVRWIKDRGFPIRDKTGRCVRMVGIADNITRRKQAEEKLRVLSRELINAQETERRRIGRELHDGIGQALTVLKINLHSVQSSKKSSACLQESIETIDRLVHQVRNLALDLRPSMLDDIGLVAALRWFVNRQAQSGGFAVHFVADNFETRLPAEVETACFRVAQEAITNVIRHAKPKNVRVEIWRCDAGLELKINDDGVGFTVEPVIEQALEGASLGLLTMKERVALIGGRLNIESSPGAGTDIRVWFPL